MPIAINIYYLQFVDGKHHLSDNIYHRIDDICFIRKGSENKIKKVNSKDILTYLMN